MKVDSRFITGLIAIGLIVAACGGPTATPATAPTEAPAATETGATTEAPAATEAQAATEAPAELNVLRVRNGTDITNLDPAFWPSTSDFAAMSNVFEGLVGYAPGTWDIENELAESIEQSEDGLSIDFKLKEGIQFHGGYGEVTAEDVKFSYERIAGLTEPALDSPYKGDWAALDHVEVIDQYSGTIVLKEPFAALWTSTLPLTSGWVVSKQAVEAMGDDFATHPIGTGPYEFVRWVPNTEVLFQPFADYWGEAYEWDEIHLIPILDDSAGEIALEAGEIDWSIISEASVERFEADDQFEVSSYVTLGYSWIAMNVQHPNLQDKNLREAIRYAVDVPSIIEAVYDGKQDRACSLVAPGQVGYWAEAPCHERDVAKAQEFLALVPEVPELTITILNTEEWRAIAEIVQANLADVGIPTEIIAQDDAAFWDGGFGEAGLTERQLVPIAFATTPDPSWSTVWFICDQVEQWNWMYWCDEQYDELHFAALKETDQERRAEMYVEMQQIWDEAAHTVWLGFSKVFLASRADLRPGVMPHGWMLPYATTSQ